MGNIEKSLSDRSTEARSRLAISKEHVILVPLIVTPKLFFEPIYRSWALSYYQKSRHRTQSKRTNILMAPHKAKAATKKFAWSAPKYAVWTPVKLNKLYFFMNFLTTVIVTWELPRKSSCLYWRKRCMKTCVISCNLWQPILSMTSYKFITKQESPFIMEMISEMKRCIQTAYDVMRRHSEICATSHDVVYVN